MSKRLKVVDFLLEDGNFKLLREDGNAILVVPKSRRKELFEEAHKGSLAEHFAAMKVT